MTTWIVLGVLAAIAAYDAINTRSSEALPRAAE